MDLIYIAVTAVVGLAAGGYGGARFGGARAGGATVWQALRAVIWLKRSSGDE